MSNKIFHVLAVLLNWSIEPTIYSKIENPIYKIVSYLTIFQLQFYCVILNLFSHVMEAVVYNQ